MVGGSGAHGCVSALWSVAAAAFRAALQRAVAVASGLRWRAARVVCGCAACFSTAFALPSVLTPLGGVPVFCA